MADNNCTLPGSRWGKSQALIFSYLQSIFAGSALPYFALHCVLFLRMWLVCDNNLLVCVFWDGCFMWVTVLLQWHCGVVVIRILIENTDGLWWEGTGSKKSNGHGGTGSKSESSTSDWISIVWPWDQGCSCTQVYGWHCVALIVASVSGTLLHATTHMYRSYRVQMAMFI